MNLKSTTMEMATFIMADRVEYLRNVANMLERRDAIKEKETIDRLISAAEEIEGAINTIKKHQFG